MSEDDKTKVFLSYSHNDRDYADMFEEKVYKSRYKEFLVITRDTRNVSYRDSFYDFMNTISKHDIVVAIVTDSYLKSTSCLYEASIALENKRLFQIMINKNDEVRYASMCKAKRADIRTDEGKLSYYKYWKAKRAALEQEKTPFAEVMMSQYDKILNGDLGILLDYLSSHVYINFTTLMNDGLDIIFKDIINEDRPKKVKELPLQEAFKILANPWTPMYAPYTIASKSYYIEKLPSSMTMLDNDNISFNGKIYSKSVIQAGVREEGPAAWGYSIRLPQGIFFRYTKRFGEKMFGWHRTHDDDIVYLEFVGSGLETLQIKNDELEWKAYIAYDLDSDY